ncbi:hypothetical protein [Streptomyces resistomycificus]|uniref:hypothetical protein n=1 Tax=Streptomyces resistomycificus TaxID=67356 RepID=UPI0004AA9E1F|nr:hypothetical protein [Streptomyces resistomycificus]KUO00454.1 hypothetical protein AQJ84_05400 [Streptomyces resistomycificus]
MSDELSRTGPSEPGLRASHADRDDLRMRGGALRSVTRPGVAVDTDSLVTNHAEVESRATAGPEVPVLRIEVAGRLDFGQVLARPPRRVFGR